MYYNLGILRYVRGHSLTGGVPLVSPTFVLFFGVSLAPAKNKIKRALPASRKHSGEIDRFS